MSLYFGSSLSLSSLSLGSSNGVRGLSFCSCSVDFVVAITASANGIRFFGSDGPLA